MNKFLRFFGLCTLSHHNTQMKDLKILSDGLEKKVEEHKREIILIRKECKKELFEFDTLITRYNESQLNALFYELINRARNDDRYSHLLERWITRLKDAHTHPAK